MWREKFCCLAKFHQEEQWLLGVRVVDIKAQTPRRQVSVYNPHVITRIGNPQSVLAKNDHVISSDLLSEERKKLLIGDASPHHEAVRYSWNLY